MGHDEIGFREAIFGAIIRAMVFEMGIFEAVVCGAVVFEADTSVVVAGVAMRGDSGRDDCWCGIKGKLFRVADLVGGMYGDADSGFSETEMRVGGDGVSGRDGFGVL